MGRSYSRNRAELSEVEEFWNTHKHDMELIRDVRVDQFIGAQGEANLRLRTHRVSMVATPADIKTRINGGTPFDQLWPEGSLGFMPAGWHKWTLIKHRANVTIVRLEDRFFRNVLTEPVKIPRPNLQALQDPVTAHLVRALLQLAVQHQPQEWPLLVDCLGTAIAARIVYQLGADGTRVIHQTRSPLSSERLQRAKDYIEACIERPIRLAQIAHAAAMSPYHFSRQFRKSTGMSPVRYVWSRRVERAKMLLHGKTLTIAEIAFTCGFSSQSHFTTMFRRMTGATPAEYRYRVFSVLFGGKQRP